ncbi:FAD-binding oxidoreductase [Pseudanabaena sp. FACHB-1998]|uniref:NAD(P)/FAD-dependent oxidoreductase n=1 Tax=Pseudanabaena sp. FACHB-1998 TaxID=2692858 RepID=UPI001680A6A7|nr:FAD-binding oxidoreductase [Pseudanabaena sp. FACHB-1998]MBD2179044.1 FAD-binding oxidoreductase [Pseudanabaena sp. FACHB-1998]
MHDWIVIGGGITGISLSYELQKAGFSVLLIEQNSQFNGSSSLGYGGISYWSGSSPITKQLCEEGINRQRNLSHELGIDTEFRELDLLLTLEVDADPQEMLSQYASCAIAPTLLNAQEAHDREPLLNTQAISGALLLPHAHVNLDCFVKAHSQALESLGGEILYAKVNRLLVAGDRLTGVSTEQGDFSAERVVVCAGGLSRALLKASGINARVYFTHAEAIDTPPVDLELRTMVMPAATKRYDLEATTTSKEKDALWDESGRELLPPSIDAGAIQFCDRRVRFGQLSRVLTDPYAAIDAQQSETKIRAYVSKVLPKIGELQGKWRNCLVAFSSDGLPLVGALEGYANLHLFSGFTSPTVYVPTLSQRFTAHALGNTDEIINQLSPNRFL